MRMEECKLEEEIYDPEYAEALIEDDSIDASEQAFIQGYTQLWGKF